MPQKVRAKFICDEIHQFNDSKSATLSAVYGTGNDENTDFSTLTPSGQLSITITNDAPAADFFQVGKSYYLDFTEAQA